MANYQSTHTGAEIDAGIDLLDKNSATQGQVLTADGTGGASWQNAGVGSSGGTQLYMHDINTDAGDKRVIVISTVNTPATNLTEFKNLLVNCVHSHLVEINDGYESDIINCGFGIIYVISNAAIKNVSTETFQSFGSDSVTQL